MKKTMAMLTALLLMLMLTACGGETAVDTSGQADTEDGSTTTTQAQQESGFSYVYEGVTITPGKAFDPTALPQAASTYEVPSCAVEGTDTVYNYTTFEVTAYNDGTGEQVYSIYFLDANSATTEGLYLGDTADRAKELYGDDYVESGSGWEYTRGDTLLSVVFQDGIVISMEYRWITEA